MIFSVLLLDKIIQLSYESSSSQHLDSRTPVIRAVRLVSYREFMYSMSRYGYTALQIAAYSTQRGRRRMLLISASTGTQGSSDRAHYHEKQVYVRMCRFGLDHSMKVIRKVNIAGCDELILSHKGFCQIRRLETLHG